MIRRITNDCIAIRVMPHGTISDFSYDLYKISLDGSEPAYIRALAEDNERLMRRFLLLTWSMEHVLNNRMAMSIQEWERHNRQDFNEYYHDQLDVLERRNWANRRAYGDYFRKKIFKVK